jgi:branched-chain amino acid transport system permease protein
MDAYLVAVSIQVCIYVLLCLGLNLHYGFTGLINFGHVAFYCVGAYTSALLTVNGTPVWIGLLCATVAGAITAYPIGLLSLRLGSHYLAIVTLGFSEVVRLFAHNEAWVTGGAEGMMNIPRPFLSLGVGPGALAYLGLLLTLNMGAIYVTLKLARSPFGRIIEAIRDSEEAVRALGKDPAGFKMRVLMIGAGLAGLAGALQAHYITYLTPEQFTPLVTFLVWMAMIMGGTGRISGAVVGSGILLFIFEGSRFIRDFVPGISAVDMASVRLCAVGLALILFTLYRPQGLMGDYSNR